MRTIAKKLYKRFAFTFIAAGEYPVTVRVTDQRGLTATQSFSVSVSLSPITP